MGRVWPIEAKPITVGRGSTQTIEVGGDERLSRSHFTVARTVGGSARISDEKSRNSTFLNGRSITEHTGSQGDVIRAGNSVWVLVEPATKAEQASPGDSPLRGTGQAISKVRLGISQVASAVVAGNPLSVLILGETGSGKEVTAQEIHRQSGRTGRIVPVNCAAIAETLAESHFFGHVPGAFSGATGHHDGVFVRADRGTLFLDELGELSLGLQAKLLRVLETGLVTPVGGSRARRVDVRVVAATNVPLKEAVDDKRFRGDLLARLQDWTVFLPSLRERREDVVFLFESFCRDFGQGVPTLSPDAVEALLIYPWPYNVRELRQVAVRLSVNTVDGESVEPDGLSTEIGHYFESCRAGNPGEGSTDIDEATLADLDIITPAQIMDALRLVRGNVTKAAQYLGMSRNTLYRRLTDYQIDPTQYR